MARAPTLRPRRPRLSSPASRAAPASTAGPRSGPVRAHRRRHGGARQGRLIEAPQPLRRLRPYRFHGVRNEPREDRRAIDLLPYGNINKSPGGVDIRQRIAEYGVTKLFSDRG